MRVATFNLHAGVDGWGRPTRVLDELKGFGADVMILPELWRADDGPDFFEDLRSSLNVDGGFAPLAHGERVTTGVGGPGWQPRFAHFRGEYGLFFKEHRPLTPSQLAARALIEHIETGTWGVAVLSRFPLEEFTINPLGRLPREKVKRALVVARFSNDGRSFYVLAIHGAHISHGSYVQYRRVNEIAATLDPGVPMLLGGDFNSWRPLLRVFLPGWRSMAKGRTWPAHHPHSQIDHIFARGAWIKRDSFTRDGGSDHLALIADLELA